MISCAFYEKFKVHLVSEIMKDTASWHSISVT